MSDFDTQAPAEPDQPTAPATDQADTPDAEDKFHDVDLSRVPEDADPREWAAQREKEMQSAFTRKTQELAAERKAIEDAKAEIELARALRDPETQAQALARLGFDLEDGEDEEPLDPEDELRQKVSALEAERQQEREAREAAAREQEVLADLGNQLDALERAEGYEFTDEEAEALVSIAVANANGEGPSIEGAFKLLTNSYTARDKRRAERKRPRVPGGGPAAKREIDLSDREAAITAAAGAAEAVMASQN